MPLARTLHLLNISSQSGAEAAIWNEIQRLGLEFPVGTSLTYDGESHAIIVTHKAAALKLLENALGKLGSEPHKLPTPDDDRPASSNQLTTRIFPAFLSSNDGMSRIDIKKDLESLGIEFPAGTKAYYQEALETVLVTHKRNVLDQIEDAVLKLSAAKINALPVSQSSE